MKLISVIIPCYNSFDFMNKCLESLENQTFKNFEVVIVDDCSSDNSYNNLLEYKSKSSLDLIIVKNDKNYGPGESRNIALQKSSGQWVCFCDSDDWYSVDFLEKMYKEILKTKSELVMCENYQVFSNGSSKICRYTNLLSSESSKGDFLVHSKSSLCILMVKRKLFDTLNIPNLYFGEDVAIIPLLILNAKSVSVVKEPLYYYFTRRGSASNSLNPKICSDFGKAFEMIYNKVNKEYPEECEYLGIQTVLYGITMNMFKCNYSYDSIKECINKFKIEFPNWHKNKYIKNIDNKKKIYLISIYLRTYIINKIYSKLHSKLVNK